MTQRTVSGASPSRSILLIARDSKSVGGEQRFYRQLIAKADERFDEHLSQMRMRT